MGVIETAFSLILVKRKARVKHTFQFNKIKRQLAYEKYYNFFFESLQGFKCHCHVLTLYFDSRDKYRYKIQIG